jgi:hypothetical protein
MLKFFLISSILSFSQLVNYNAEFTQLKNKLEDYGFEMIIAIPPDYKLPKQQTDFQRRRLRKPYGLLDASSKSVWINPIVFELGISNPVLIHEAVHAAQLCHGNNNLQPLQLDIEPIKQAQPFFKRYVDIHNQVLEKEAYTVQTQPNSYELAISLLDKHCRI